MMFLPLSADSATRLLWQSLSAARGPKVKLRDAVYGLGAARMQIVRSGTHEQAEKTTALLDEARNAIDTMLACD